MFQICLRTSLLTRLTSSIFLDIFSNNWSLNGILVKRLNWHLSFNLIKFKIDSARLLFFKETFFDYFRRLLWRALVWFIYLYASSDQWVRESCHLNLYLWELEAQLDARERLYDESKERGKIVLKTATKYDTVYLKAPFP